MTIGNILKELRRKPSQRTHILLGYLLTTPLHHVQNKASHRRMVANLFHHCVSHMLEPLKSAGETGVLMSSGERITRRTFPIFSCFVSDYPEQVLVLGSVESALPRPPGKSRVSSQCRAVIQSPPRLRSLLSISSPFSISTPSSTYQVLLGPLPPFAIVSPF